MRITASVYVGIVTSILCYLEILGMAFLWSLLLPLWYWNILFFVCLFSALTTYWALITPFSFARKAVLLFVAVLPICFCMYLFFALIEV
jgi:hypothetical protein